jgi:hypothetical protein
MPTPAADKGINLAMAVTRESNAYSVTPGFSADIQTRTALVALTERDADARRTSRALCPQTDENQGNSDECDIGSADHKAHSRQTQP